MTLSKKLLLALAGASLTAPLAASAQDLASLNGSAAINDYMQQQDVDRFRAWESKNQVTSVNQFSDVQPTDWAYQALSNLVEKYGCVAGYPNGKFKGGNAMTRYEAAALLNACLDRISEVTDELQKLLNEFDSELTVLTSRVDGLESKVGQLQAQQFSTTTKLKGEVNMILGGVPDYPRTSSGTPDKTAFNYDVRLSFDTSWTGKDLLRTRLRSGNFSSAPFGSSSNNLFKLDKAETARDGAQSNVWIDRLYYTFPVGKEIKLTAGTLLRNTEVVGFLPSAYKAQILDFFGLAGAPGVYNKATGAGFAAQWKQSVKKGNPYFTFDTSYIAERGNDSTTGMFNNDGAQNINAQLGFKGQNYGVALGYRYGSEGSRVRVGNGYAGNALVSGQTSNSMSVGAFWQPLETGWIPSISVGYGFNDMSGSYATSADPQRRFSSSRAAMDSQSWTVALQWDDAFMKGNSAGFAFGQAANPNNNPTTGSACNSTSVCASPSDGWMYEIFYKFQVTDNISITPALFWVQDMVKDSVGDGWGGVIQTQFRF
ncbi:carbohydrate porin [Cyanobium sp. T1B-Tous]|uniref:iron uptake porin n=1 Tax=Cyanobium sp. T1B-Tous TaxID=2823721 RepID=UPI0020CCAC0B|nr:iron uptake porin [Cyanobium sp. T1B-Tous]MCP9805353.1 carbohydrate porin [Cyanobium sp. T1B-Tous]